MDKKLKAAWTGFRLPDTDPWVMYETYAKMGFKAVDGDISRLPGDKVENLKRLNDLGLRCLCTGAGFGKSMADIANDPEMIKACVERAHFYDVKYVNLGWTSIIRSFGEGYGVYGGYDEMMKDMEGMNALVKVLADEGLVPLYHNHYQEFLYEFKGVSVIDYYLTQVDPRLKLKLDVGWVYVGGVDPVPYMEKAKDRIGLIHLKDFTEDIAPRYLVNAIKDQDFGFTAVGTGKLDIKGICKKALEIGQEYMILEQDRTRVLDWKDALQCGYYNIKETGLVE